MWWALESQKKLLTDLLKSNPQSLWESNHARKSKFITHWQHRRVEQFEVMNIVGKAGVERWRGTFELWWRILRHLRYSWTFLMASRNSAFNVQPLFAFQANEFTTFCLRTCHEVTRRKVEFQRAASVNDKLNFEVLPTFTSLNYPLTEVVAGCDVPLPSSFPANFAASPEEIISTSCFMFWNWAVMPQILVVIKS